MNRSLLLTSLTLTAALWVHAYAVSADDVELINTEPSKQKFLTPQEALAGMAVPDGFEISLYAAEPDVRQPIALATDDRGRLWVCENYTYAERERNFDDRHKDRIVILEDTDGDGSSDKRTVFWDQGRRLTSVEIGYGGAWVLDAPNLLFIPDADGDDNPDGEPVVMLDGWNDDAVRHNIVNGLRWGPDGWLYGRHGIMATSTVGRPGASPDQRTSLNCCIWRFHPTKHSFEVVCEGTTNSWGMDWDANGELFFINTVIGHLWHAVPGAYFRRMYGEHFNPHVYQVIEQTADHFHWDTKETWSDIRKLGVTKTTDEAGGGHAHCGMVIVPPGLWGKEYDNSVLTINLHGQRINRDVLLREAATFVGKHGPDFMHATDPWFRGVELHFGPDGVLYVADWSDVGECHENDGVHRTSGRIYQIRPTREWMKRALVRTRGVARMTNEQLVRASVSDQPWLSIRAIRLLAEREAAGDDLSKTHKELKELFIFPESQGLSPNPTVRQRLAALWALHASGGCSEPVLLKLLSHKSENMRIWAVRLLADDGRLSDAALNDLTHLARSDKSGLVMTYLASILNRLPPEQRWPVAEQLVRHGRFADDRVYPLMVWYGIEPALTSDPERAVKLAASSKLPIVREFIARRLTSEIERQPAAVALLVDLLGASSPNVSVQLDILHGMTDALRGWRKAPAPAIWASVSPELAKANNANVQRLSRELSVVFGDGRALNELKKIARDNGVDLDERRSAIRALVLARDKSIVSYLQGLLGNRDLAGDAIAGLAAFDDKDTPKLLVQRFGGFRNGPKREAIETLVARPTYAAYLLQAVAAGKIPRNQVSAFQLRQMQGYDSSLIKTRIAELWPELEEQAAEKQQRIAELRKDLTPDVLAKADASRGRALFNNSCAKCHTLFGEGRKLAPDLTGAQRSNLNYLLENIVDPSATVSKNFQMTIVLQKDGRVYNGVVVGQNEKTIQLQTINELVVIPRDDIEETAEAQVSMMPEGMLKFLDDDQIRNLIKYLMSPSQVPLAE
ncbi:MAG: PVC-type heme-binding CxxCH protein [Planctomycetota bacterium]|jgi:putative membrane-bound dehydrogenase-like protein